MWGRKKSTKSEIHNTAMQCLNHIHTPFGMSTESLFNSYWPTGRRSTHRAIRTTCLFVVISSTLREDHPSKESYQQSIKIQS
jgi:hypothetical protein